MVPLRLGVIGDPGGSRYNSSRFYAYPGGGWRRKSRDGIDGANRNVNSSGPAQSAVAAQLRAQALDGILGLGDLVYNTGTSTHYDEEVGRLFNDFLAPYPSPYYADRRGPYRQERGRRLWPFDLYDAPHGYPDPITGGRGGSPDGRNRFWPTPGNHEYYLRAGRSETNISLDTPGSTVPNREVIGRSSTAVPQPYVDYFAWLKDPGLIRNRQQLRIGEADASGNRGIYYRVSLGEGSGGRPLVDVFSLDTMRLTMNVGGYYPNFTNGFGEAVLSRAPDFNLEYDPSLRPTAANGTVTVAANSSDPHNGWRQFRWLRRELKRSEAQWQVLIGHQPVYSSGEWGGSQPDDTLSSPVLQKFLAALPPGSFDAYLNGHSHYYQRVLEGNEAGIGAGIPFITQGNGGRLLDSINETRYCDSVYEPRNWTGRLEAYMGVGNPRLKGVSTGGVPYEQTGMLPYLLPSDPTTVGVSGGYLVPDAEGKPVGFTPGAYGFGFGGGTLEARDHSLHYRYSQPEVEDPAIAENLDPATRLPALRGWEDLRAGDWRPRDPITGLRSPSLEHTAQVRIQIDPASRGTVSAVAVENPGAGYMGSQRGDHRVDLEIRGNDAAGGPAGNPEERALVRLHFAGGALRGVRLLEGGSGYRYLGQLEQAGDTPGATVRFTEPQSAVVPLNLSLIESWYALPSTPYQDSYLITETRARVQRGRGPAGEPLLEVRLVGHDPQSRRELRQLNRPGAWSTGSSGQGAQRGYRRAQAGRIDVRGQDGGLLGQGELSGGLGRIPIPAALEAGTPLEIRFSGDPFSSHLVNFLPSVTAVTL